MSRLHTLVLLFAFILVLWNNCFISAIDDLLETESEDSMEAKVFLYKVNILCVNSFNDYNNCDVIFLQFTDTNPVVEAKDFVITYQLINNGNGIATGIEVRDRYDPNR